MSISTPTLRRLVLALSLGATTLWVSPVAAKEPFEQFLEGLRRLEMDDAAVLYLDSLRNKPNLDPDLKKILPYEEGVSLLAGAQRLQDTVLRFKQLDAAADKFREFLKDNQKHDRAPAASTQLGNVLVARARAKLDESERPTKAAQKPALVKEAKDQFKQAQTALESAEKQLEEIVNKPEFKAPIPPAETKRIKARDEVRNDYMQAKLFAASVLYEAAKAYDKGDEKKKLLVESAARYQKIADRWRTRLIGSYATMWQGRSLQEIADANSRKQALALYDQLLANPDTDPTIRQVQMEALRLALSVLMDPEEKKGDEAIRRGKEWIAQFKGQEGNSEDGLAIKWMVASALKTKADGEKDANAKKKLQTEVRNLLKDVAKTDNPFRKEAQKLMSGNGGDGPPATFDDAFDLARTELETSRVFATELAETKDPAKRKELEAKVNGAEKNAFKNFQLAMDLKNMASEDAEKPNAEKVNQARYFLAFLYLQSDDFYRAAVLGEYLARKHPDSSIARPAAQISLAAYGQAYNLAKPDQRDTEGRQIESLANFIMTKWPQDAAAADARQALIDVLIRAREQEKVLKLLSEVDAEAPARANVELKVGNFLWTQYLIFSSLDKESDTRPSQEKLDALAKQAQALLEDGIARAGKATGSNGQLVQAMGMLSLAQLYTRSGQFDKAVGLLEQKPNGPLTLVQANDPMIARLGNFKSEVYKIGLQAYVNTKDGQPKAEQMMTGLEEAFADQGPEAQARLTQIYVKLGRELQEDMKRFQDQNKLKEYGEALAAAETFLKRISSRTEGNSYATLSWVAETFYGLGESASNAGDAKRMFDSAAVTYKAILARAAESGFFPPTNADQHKLRIQIQLAKCDREAGKFEQALDQLRNLLKLETNRNNIDAQREAALTYQAWGKAKKDPMMFYKAIQGEAEKPNSPKKLIWGWAYAAKLLQKAPSLNDRFHEARYNMSLCLYERALVGDAKDKVKNLTQAAQSITIMAGLYPEMGGEVQLSAYDVLLKKIETSQGKKPEGLKPVLNALQAKPAAATQTSAAK